MTVSALLGCDSSDTVCTRSRSISAFFRQAFAAVEEGSISRHRSSDATASFQRPKRY